MTSEVVMHDILLAIFGWLMHDFCTMNPLSQSENILCQLWPHDPPSLH